VNLWVDANGWPVPPTVLLGCLVSEILYFRGWRLLVKTEQAKRTARDRALPAPQAGSLSPRQGPVSGGDSVAGDRADGGDYQWESWFWRGTSFLGAIVAFLLAASAPIDILSSRLFWVHMVQHLLFLVVIAPLLVAAAPLLPLWLGLPRRARKLVKGAVKPNVWRALYRAGQWLQQQPAIACGLLIIGTWAWHWPPLYDLALTNAVIHDWCEHVTFLAVSIIFWAQVIPSPPLHSRLGYLGRIGCVGIAIAQNVVLAALLGFAQVPLYAPYVHLAPGPGGLSALQDQQLGAGIMWTFGDVPFGMALSILVYRWLDSQSDDARIALEAQRR
jgi:cytochrome c oxidase assembly factor CtaG